MTVAELQGAVAALRSLSKQNGPFLKVRTGPYSGVSRADYSATNYIVPLGFSDPAILISEAVSTSPAFV
jgi:hypothetical protein